MKTLQYYSFTALYPGVQVCDGRVVRRVAQIAGALAPREVVTQGVAPVGGGDGQ